LREGERKGQLPTRAGNKGAEKGKRVRCWGFEKVKRKQGSQRKLKPRFRGEKTPKLAKGGGAP